VGIQKKESEEMSKDKDIEQAERIRNQEEERKRKIKVTLMKLFHQTKVGCAKDLCFNKYCFKNPFGKYYLSVNQIFQSAKF
jgi:hypothetical protein